MKLGCFLLLVAIIILIYGEENNQPVAHKNYNGCKNENGICGRLVGQSCSHSPENHCHRGLTCRFHHKHDKVGICKVPTASACMVKSQVHRHGEKFSPSCRTQCICQNGTYACTNNCANENIVPDSACIQPQLVEVPGRCCREWVCNSVLATTPPACVEETTQWSECSTICGGGLSTRFSNANPLCRPRNESRLCQRQSCKDVRPFNHYNLHHRLRKRHSCKATQRWRGVHLRIGNCISRRRYTPRHCGPCPQHDICCRPALTTTIKVEMVCNNLPRIDEESEDIHNFFIGLIKPKDDIWIINTKNPTHHKTDYVNLANRRLAQFKSFQTSTDYLPPVTTYPDFTDVYILRVEWVLKCECGRKICNNDPEELTEINQIDYMKPKNRNKSTLLHRVHRTSP